MLTLFKALRGGNNRLFHVSVHSHDMGGYFEGFARFPRISIQAVYRESDRLTIIKIKNSLFSNILLKFASLKFRDRVFITQ